MSSDQRHTQLAKRLLEYVHMGTHCAPECIGCTGQRTGLEGSSKNPGAENAGCSPHRLSLCRSGPVHGKSHSVPFRTLSAIPAVRLPPSPCSHFLPSSCAPKNGSDHFIHCRIGLLWYPIQATAPWFQIPLRVDVPPERVASWHWSGLLMAD